MSIPISLYIHIPWCISKCPYCDFNSHTLRGEIAESQYLNALLQDFQQNIQWLQHRTFSSIFIGGGTPSLMSCEFYQQLLSKLKGYLPISQNIEITLEANPGTFEQQRFAGYREAGINRLSVGVQSFQNEKLKHLGRIHGAAEAKKAIIAAKKVGFDNLNIDLMHGLQNQSIEDAIEDLTTAIELNPSHISWYQLTLEPNTYFSKFPPPLPNDEQVWEMQISGKELLKKQGYLQYEISAYSRKNQQSQHNLNYWQFGDYLGIGAGAHSKLTDLKTMEVHRHSNVKSPKNYLNPEKLFIQEQQTINSDQLAFEFMLNAFRLMQPLPILLFEQRTGLSRDFITEKLMTAKENQFLNYDNEYIQLSALGHRFLNDLLEIFLP